VAQRKFNLDSIENCIVVDRFGEIFHSSGNLTLRMRKIPAQAIAASVKGGSARTLAAPI